MLWKEILRQKLKMQRIAFTSCSPGSPEPDNGKRRNGPGLESRQGTHGNACSRRMKRLVCYSSQTEEKRAVEGGKSINCSYELCSQEAKVDFTQSSWPSLTLNLNKKLISGVSTTGKTEYCCPKNLWDNKIQYFRSLAMVSAEDKSRGKKRRKNWRSSREERMRGWIGAGEEYLSLTILKSRSILESYFIKNINILKLISQMGKLRHNEMKRFLANLS